MILYAVIETGGKQYTVAAGDTIYVEKLPAQDGQTVELDRVLAVFETDKVKMGAPTVAGVTVSAKAVKTGRGKKILVFKYKAKKNYRKRKGHRQPYTKLEIVSINAK